MILKKQLKERNLILNKPVTSLVDHKWTKSPDIENSNTSNVQRSNKLKTREAKTFYSSKVNSLNKKTITKRKGREQVMDKSYTESIKYEIIPNSFKISSLEEPYSPDDKINKIAYENLQNRRNKIYYHLNSNSASYGVQIVDLKNNEEFERIEAPIPQRK